MRFWAAVVEYGSPVKVEIGEEEVLHLSQISLGEIKKEKGKETVNTFLHMDGKKHVFSTLIVDKLPQQQLDLIFEKEFELSHNWKNGTVFFYGYMADNPFEYEDSESDEDITLTDPEEVKVETKEAKEETPADVKKTKAASQSGAAKQKVKIVEPSPVKTDDDDDSSDEDDSDSGDSTDEDEDDSDSEGEDGSDSEEEETPTPKKKVESGKKRANTPAVQTPQAKKAKLNTPQKTEGKKSTEHVATPYPKQPKGPKQTPATTSAASKAPQTPKSAGSHACKSCSKTFNSEAAVESHTKAKHSAGK